MRSHTVIVLNAIERFRTFDSNGFISPLSDEKSIARKTEEGLNILQELMNDEGKLSELKHYLLWYGEDQSLLSERSVDGLNITLSEHSDSIFW